MRVIGFNFKKISSEKHSTFQSSPSIDIHFEFPNIKEEEISLLKDSKAIKFDFKHSLSYYEKNEKNENSSKSSSPQAKLEFEGDLTLALSKEDAKEILANWKKKQISSNVRDFLTNFVARRCLPQAVPLVDELSLPYPFLNIPQFSSQPSEKTF